MAWVLGAVPPWSMPATMPGQAPPAGGPLQLAPPHLLLGEDGVLRLRCLRRSQDVAQCDEVLL